MGTRCLTIFQEAGKDLAVLYTQFDGYPAGWGKDLAKYLKDMQIVNGISGEAVKGKIANGMSCLAAQVIARFKRSVGNVYPYPAKTRNAGEEYRYTLYVLGEATWDKPLALRLKVEECYAKRPKVLYEGKISEYLPWLKDYAKAQTDE